MVRHPRRMQQSSERGMRAVLREMRVWRPEAKYYAVTVVATRGGKAHWSVQSNWVGPSEKYPGWERREASEIYPDRMTSIWTELGEQWVVVHNKAHLALWLRIGGHALVEKELALAYLRRWVEPRECAPDGPVGFHGADSLQPHQRSRRISRGIRKQVKRRDGHACVRCGRAPPDVELSKHHVLPYRRGGLTQSNNLVTLCSACHREMDESPDDGVLLGALLPAENRKLEGAAAEHQEGVRRHRTLIAELLARQG